MHFGWTSVSYKLEPFAVIAVVVGCAVKIILFIYVCSISEVNRFIQTYFLNTRLLDGDKVTFGWWHTATESSVSPVPI